MRKHEILEANMDLILEVNVVVGICIIVFGRSFHIVIGRSLEA